jgi:hypothetical protein
MSKLRTLDEIIADLSKPIPPQFLTEKTKGGTKLTVFTWVIAQRFLDLYAPGWQNFNTPVLSNERVVVDCKLCIPTSDMGLVCRAATGDDSEDEDEVPDFETPEAKKKWEQEQRGRQFGSPVTRAEGQAFKRAATRFGFGLHLRRNSGALVPMPAINDAPHAPQPPQKAAAARVVSKTSERFTEAWKSLKSRGWNKDQITTQVKVVAGNTFTEFSALPEDVQIAVVEHLEGIK